MVISEWSICIPLTLPHLFVTPPPSPNGLYSHKLESLCMSNAELVHVCATAQCSYFIYILHSCLLNCSRHAIWNQQDASRSSDITLTSTFCFEWIGYTSVSLDRLYSSHVLNYHCRTVYSTVLTGHWAVIAWEGADAFHDINKKSTVTQYRKRTPSQHAAFLAHLSHISWDLCQADTQLSFDTFYGKAVNLLNQFYPLRTITVSNRDPYTHNPRIKAMLRLRNN